MRALWALAVLLIIAAGAALGSRTHVQADGVVQRIAADRRSVVLRRDDVAGATGGLTLSFDVDDPIRLAGLADGSAVQFRYSQRFAGIGRTLDEITARDTASRTHNHSPQHGGVVEMIDRLHVEATAEHTGRIRLWLTDFWRQPLPLRATTGTVTVTLGDTPQHATLAPNGDALEASIPPFTAGRIELLAALTHDGAPLTARFVLSLDDPPHRRTQRTIRRCRTLAPGSERPRCVIRFAEPVVSVATAGRGDVAVVADGNGQLGVWRPSTGELLTRLAYTPPAGEHDDAHGHDPPVATVSTNGQNAFVAMEDALLRYDLSDGSLSRALPLKGGHVESIAAAPDGSAILVANRYGASAWLYDFETNRMLRTIPATREVTATAFSPDGRTVVIGDAAGTVRVAPVSDAANDRTFIGLDQATRGVAITDDDVAALSRDGTLAVWARDAGTTRLRIPTTIQGGRLAVSDESGMAAVAGEQRVQIYALSDGRLLDTVTLPHGRITGMAFGNDTLLLTDARGRMTIRDIANP